MASTKIEINKNFDSADQDFDARKVFHGLQFYSRRSHSAKEVRFGNLRADRKEHKWERETLEFLNLGTKVNLTFHIKPYEPPQYQESVQKPETEVSGRKNLLRMVSGLIYHSAPSENPRDYLPKNKLEIVIYGKKEKRMETIRKIERETGRPLADYIVRT